jgi:hypothetical protein
MARTELFSRYTPGGVFTIFDISRHPASIFFVHSGTGTDADGHGESPDSPFATIDYAVGKCTANAGDVIYAMPGHNEVLAAAADLDLDVIGITVIFLGEGDDKAKVTFGTDAGADMDVDAANVTLINPKFVAAVDALTGPIDVNAADFKIINGEYHDATDINTIDCIVAVADATRMKIHGWKFYKANEGGTQKQSNIQLNGVDDAELFDIDIRGDFATGNIENLTDEVLNIRMKNIYLDNLNATPKPGIVLDADADGLAENVKIRVASGVTYVSNVSDINWNDSYGIGTDGYDLGDPIGTAAATGLEGKIDTIDGYHDKPAANTTDNNQMRDVIGNKTDSAAAGAASTTESIMAYAKQLVGGQIIIDAFHDAPAADTTDNAQVRDVVGNKEDAAAAGAVSTTESVMAYAKQLVTGQIVIDAFHDAPAADTTDNAQMRDIIGNKEDAAAAGAVSTTESIMAYAKQLVTGQIVIDAFHDVPAADTTDNAQLRDVVGNKEDAAAAGAVSATESLMAFAKQAVEALRAADTCIVITKDITSSNIPDDGGGTPLAAPLTGAASGDLLLEEIIMQCDATGLAGPTTIQVVCDNVKGLTGATVPIWDEATANLGANTKINNSDADVNQLPIMLEDTKKLYINGDSGVGTGAGVVEVIMKFRKVTPDATIAAA